MAQHPCRSSVLSIRLACRRAADGPAAVRQPSLALQTSSHPVRRHSENALDVIKPRVREVVEVSETMLEILTSGDVFNSETHLLQRHSTMIVGAQHVDTGLLQRAEQAPFAAGLVVFAQPIILAVPHGLVLEERFRLQEDAQVLRGGWLVPPFQFRTRCGRPRSLLGLSRCDFGGAWAQSRSAPRPARD